MNQKHEKIMRVTMGVILVMTVATMVFPIPILGIMLIASILAVMLEYFWFTIIEWLQET